MDFQASRQKFRKSTASINFLNPPLRLTIAIINNLIIQLTLLFIKVLVSESGSDTESFLFLLMLLKL
jgi:hypothetical protein